MRSIFDPLKLPRSVKRVIVAGVDIALCIITVWLAYFLRIGEWLPLSDQPALPVILSVSLALPIFAAFGLYRIIIRHAGSELMISTAVACSVYGLGYSAVITVYGVDGVPRTLGLIQPVLLFLAVSATRLLAGRLLAPRVSRGANAPGKARVLIYGAGAAGRQLSQALSTSDEMRVVGFLDDDWSLHGSNMKGLPVLDPQHVQRHVRELNVSEVLLAISSVSRTRRREIIDELKAIRLKVKILPGLVDLAHGKVRATDLREVTIEDLLQRDPVPNEIDFLQGHITDRTVLVTGAGGSIGSELCRQIASMGPRKLLLVEKSEFALYSIHGELASQGHRGLVPLLASVTDEVRMDTIIQAWKPEMIFHAAAYKHVPLVEHNPLEGLRNNAVGTAIMAGLAAQHGVHNFVLVSTDKAVRPTNVMGASKRLAELVLQGMSDAPEGERTCFSMVRFGNVLGSSGSVVPLFSQQIKAGGPVTITHPDITRYFMTIPEAVHLVLQASAMAEGGEVFVLDMGQPVRIVDLARNMIHLSGLTVRDEQYPEGDIQIDFVGLRAGEKLYEELLIGNNPKPTAHPRIMKAAEPALSWTKLRRNLAELEKIVAAGDVCGARALLGELMPEYAPACEVVDLVTMERAEKSGNLSRHADTIPALKAPKVGITSTQTH